MRVLVESKQITEVDLRDSVGIEKRDEIRRLMQVNREARSMVLSKHQLVMWARLLGLPGRLRPYESFSFVNWELDLFSIISNGIVARDIITYSEPFNRIKNLAFGIEGDLNITDELPIAMRRPYYSYEYNCSSQLEWRWACESVERIVLIVPRRILWTQIRIRTRRYIGGSLIIRHEVDEIRRPWRDSGHLLVNEYGLHTATQGPPDYDYKTCKALLERETEGLGSTYESVSFFQWLDMVVTEERKAAIKDGRNVEFQIMLDHQGIRDGYSEGYTLGY